MRGTNTLNTPLNYTVYKTSNQIEVSSSCSDKTGIVDGAKIYYEECTITNLESLGSPITEGTINTSETATTIELIGDEFITSTNDGISVYYYVVLEYPNLDESQNIDIGGSFSGEVTIEESDAEPDLNLVAVMVEKDDEDYVYDYSDTVPTSGYRLDQERSSCQVNGVEASGVNMTYENGELTVDGLTQAGTVCTVYFTKLYRTGNPSEVILAGRTVQTRNFPITRYTTLFGQNGYGDIYESLENGKKTYYFAGNPTDNWVYFAGFYWRIIRINGDGSIRMIYNGTSTAPTGISTQLSDRSDFNSAGDKSYYVGLKYTIDEQRGTDVDSTIMMALNDWYVSNINLEERNYISKSTGFCSDRSLDSTTPVWSSMPSSSMYYAAHERLVRLENSVNPTFDCDEEDILSVEKSS